MFKIVIFLCILNPVWATQKSFCATGWTPLFLRSLTVFLVTKTFQSNEVFKMASTNEVSVISFGNQETTLQTYKNSLEEIQI